MDDFWVSCFDMKLPALMFVKEEEREEPLNVSFFSLKENKLYQSNALRSLEGCRCVGSSHGWLILLNQNSNPFLLNVVQESLFALSPKETFPHIQSITQMLTIDGQNYFEIHYKDEKDSVCFSLKTLQEWLMVKSVLSADPSCTNNYAVITIYNLHCKTKLAIWRPKDNEWTGLYGELDSYDDIVCRDGTLLALGDGPSVEIWDLNSTKSPTTRSKRMIQVPCPRKFTESYKLFSRDLYAFKWYLVSSSDHDLVLVVRRIGEFVRPYDGEVVYEADTLTKDSTQPLVCPYSTVGFDIYKLDFEGKRWVQVDSLNDTALFIGGNHSTSVSVKENPQCKGNAIYFTDDYWERMDEDVYYGGHDMGVFKLEDGTIEPFFDCDQERFEPPPFWIIPN